MRALAIAFVFCAAGCGTQEPRAVSFFEANGEERARVLASCVNGGTENGECVVAELADSRVKQADRSERSDDALRQSIARDRAKARGQEVR